MILQQILAYFNKNQDHYFPFLSYHIMRYCLYQRESVYLVICPSVTGELESSSVDVDFELDIDKLMSFQFNR